MDYIIGIGGVIAFLVWSPVIVGLLLDLRKERVDQIKQARGHDPYVLPRARRVALAIALWVCLGSIAASSVSFYIPIFSLDVSRIVGASARLVLDVLGPALLWTWWRFRSKEQN